MSNITDKEYLIFSQLAYLDFSNDVDGYNCYERKIVEIIGENDNRTEEQIEIFDKIAPQKHQDNIDTKYEWYKDTFEEWSVFWHSRNIITGYYCVVFRKEDNLLFAFRGTEPETEPLQDLVITDAQIATGVLSIQFVDSIEMIKAFKLYLENEMGKTISDFNYYTTGHSLGGGIAQYFGAMSKLKGLEISGGATYNGVGVVGQRLVSKADFMGYFVSLFNSIMEIIWEILYTVDKEVENRGSNFGYTFGRYIVNEVLEESTEIEDGIISDINLFIREKTGLFFSKTAEFIADQRDYMMPAYGITKFFNEDVQEMDELIETIVFSTGPIKDYINILSSFSEEIIKELKSKKLIKEEEFKDLNKEIPNNSDLEIFLNKSMDGVANCKDELYLKTVGMKKEKYYTVTDKFKIYDTENLEEDLLKDNLYEKLGKMCIKHKKSFTLLEELLDKFKIKVLKPVFKMINDDDKKTKEQKEDDEKQLNNILKLLDEISGNVITGGTHDVSDKFFKGKFLKHIYLNLKNAHDFNENYTEGGCTKISNFYHSRDIVGGSFKHVGQGYIIDKQLENKDSEYEYSSYVKISDFVNGLFFGGRDFTKFHDFDIFLAYMNDENSKSDYIENKEGNPVEDGDLGKRYNRDYLKAVMRATLDNKGISNKIIARAYNQYKNTSSNEMLIKYFTSIFSEPEKEVQLPRILELGEELKDILDEKVEGIDELITWVVYDDDIKLVLGHNNFTVTYQFKDAYPGCWEITSGTSDYNSLDFSDVIRIADDSIYTSDLSSINNHSLYSIYEKVVDSVSDYTFLSDDNYIESLVVKNREGTIKIKGAESEIIELSGQLVKLEPECAISYTQFDLEGKDIEIYHKNNNLIIKYGKDYAEKMIIENFKSGDFSLTFSEEEKNVQKESFKNININDKEMIILNDISTLRFREEDIGKTLFDIIYDGNKERGIDSLNSGYLKKYEINKKWYNSVLNEWKLFYIEKLEKLGVYVYAYVKDKNAVIAFNRVRTDINYINGGMVTYSYNRFSEFMSLQFQMYYFEEFSSKISDYCYLNGSHNIFFTGFSEGGGIAQYLGATLKDTNSSPNNVITYNSSGILNFKFINREALQMIPYKYILKNLLKDIEFIDSLLTFQETKLGHYYENLYKEKLTDILYREAFSLDLSSSTKKVADELINLLEKKGYIEKESIGKTDFYTVKKYEELDSLNDKEILELDLTYDITNVIHKNTEFIDMILSLGEKLSESREIEKLIDEIIEKIIDNGGHIGEEVEEKLENKKSLLIKALKDDYIYKIDNSIMKSAYKKEKKLNKQSKIRFTKLVNNYLKNIYLFKEICDDSSQEENYIVNYSYRKKCSTFGEEMVGDTYLLDNNLQNINEYITKYNNPMFLEVKLNSPMITVGNDMNKESESGPDLRILLEFNQYINTKSSSEKKNIFSEQAKENEICNKVTDNYFLYVISYALYNKNIFGYKKESNKLINWYKAYKFDSDISDLKKYLIKIIEKKKEIFFKNSIIKRVNEMTVENFENLFTYHKDIKNKMINLTVKDFMNEEEFYIPFNEENSNDVDFNILEVELEKSKYKILDGYTNYNDSEMILTDFLSYKKEIKISSRDRSGVSLKFNDVILGQGIRKLEKSFFNKMFSSDKKFIDDSGAIYDYDDGELNIYYGTENENEVNIPYFKNGHFGITLDGITIASNNSESKTFDAGVMVAQNKNANKNRNATNEEALNPNTEDTETA